MTIPGKLIFAHWLTVVLLLALAVMPVSRSLAQEPAAPQADPQITDLDQLLQVVREQQQRQRQRNAEREREFVSDNQRQQELLASARRDFERRKRENQPLVAVTEKNAAEIASLEKQLQELVQEMGDLSTTFHEFAGDFSAVMQQSMITAQLPERSDRLQALAASRGQPTIADIETLWLLLQEEMTEAGKVTLFNASVVAVDGTAQSQEVLRIGTFSAYANGEFLRYVPETGELLLLSRQPAARFRGEAKRFVEQPSGVASVIVDPTRGNLLGMLAYTPGLKERIEQGGSIGLIILFLGAFGLLLTVWRTLYLSVVYLKMRVQMRDISKLRHSNPLGRVLASVEGISLDDEELVQLKLDEAVLSEVPALERGNGLIKLLAATSPLLGLLGTVTGMILTFQAISLFGTGDPKLMAGGISQALVTTVLGLVVAIPLLFGHSVINYLSRSTIQRLDEQCAGVLARNADSKAGR
jgi:biopolymer transport protein ExbB